jgi:hypothetical protein
VVQSHVVSFLVLQFGWFACVLGARWGIAWLGPLWVLGAIAFVVPHPPRVRTVLYLAGFTLVGFLVDTGLLQLGLLARADGVRFAPLWLTALWPNFGLATLPNRSLWSLRHRLWLAALLGAIAGPLAYRGGARLADAGAAAVSLQGTQALLAIGFAWAIIVPLALLAARRIQEQDGPDLL